MLPKSYSEPSYKSCGSCKYFGDGRDWDDEGYTACLKYAPPQIDISEDKSKQRNRFRLYIDKLCLNNDEEFNVHENGSCDEWER